MSRKQVTLAVLLAAALVFGGTATTLGMPGGGGLASDASEAEVGSNAPGAVQTQNVTNTSVTFENQTSNGSAVNVSEAALTDGGFVVIHNADLLNGSVLGSVVGVSQHLEAGVNENVTVELDEQVNESQTLLAVAYRDTNDNQEYDFVDDRGGNDSAYTVNNQVVVDEAFVTVEGEPVETTTETTTTTETPTTTETTEIPTTTATPTTIETTTPETTTTTETTTTPETTTTTETTTTPETTTTTTTETTTTTTETTTTTTTTETTTPETTTTETTTDEPVAESEFVFRVDNANVENVSFLVGDSAEPDQVVFVEDTEVRDETVELDLTEILREGELAEGEDDRTVQFVLRDVDVENVTLVVTAPEGVTPRLVRGPPADETTPVETTTTPEETTTTTEETTTTTEETTTTETTTTETTTTETTTTPEETTTVPGETVTEEPADEVTSLRVSDLTAPSTLVLNEGQLVVNARLTNPGDEAITDTVELRVGGTVVETQRVEVAPGESERVQFRVDRQTLDVEPGDTFVGVLTRDFGQVKQVTVRETGQPDEDDETTTTEVVTTTPEETTTTEDTTTTEETTTTTAEETTTDEADDGVDDDAADAEQPSLRVSALDAPSSLVLDEGTLVVTAELRNPTDEAVTDTAELRVGGTVIETQRVEVGPGETEQVRFEVDKQDLGLAPGETFLEVLTRDFGESITVTVEDE